MPNVACASSSAPRYSLRLDRPDPFTPHRNHMTVVYLASFIGGLLLAVRIMIAGVERSRDEHPTGERSFRLSPPVVSSLATVFGLVGYILARRGVGLVTQL